MQPARGLIGVALLVVMLVVAGCGAGGGGAAQKNAPIRVASKGFAEQLIIGEMYALMLEDAGLTVERKLSLGETPDLQGALERGEIDLYPEYTGTGLMTVLKQPANSNQQEVFKTVSEMYKRNYDLVWLEPAPMNNTQALAMTEEQANQLGVKTISEMVAKADQLRMIGPPEFRDREDGLPGIKRGYGDFALKEYIAVDPAVRYEELVAGKAEVAVAFGTDGEIAAYNLIVLQDDKLLFPPYQVAPVVRQSVLDAHPEVRELLNKLAPKLTNETMQRLNYEVSGKQRQPAEVAKEFLQRERLVK
jgi:osmoprotectant transport system substrate-binding protein